MGATQEELGRLYRRDGVITPQSVRVAALEAGEESPLWRHFTWDEGEAALKCQLDEARQLIARYHVTLVGADDTTVKVRAYSRAAEGGFKATADMMRDDQDRDFLMAQALRDLGALKAKYKSLLAFQEVLETFIANEEAA